MRGYQGRLWDAPMTDDLPKLLGLAGAECICGETIHADDDAVALGSVFHLECLMRSTMGDIAHLEQRCSCFGGDGAHDTGTYREQAKRSLQWMIDHGIGRWAE